MHQWILCKTSEQDFKYQKGRKLRCRTTIVMVLITLFFPCPTEFASSYHSFSFTMTLVCPATADWRISLLSWVLYEKNCMSFTRSFTVFLCSNSGGFLFPCSELETFELWSNKCFRVSFLSFDCGELFKLIKYKSTFIHCTQIWAVKVLIKHDSSWDTKTFSIASNFLSCATKLM